MNDKKIHFVIQPRGYGKCYKEYKEVIDYLENKITKLLNKNKKLQQEKEHYKHLYSKVKKQKDGVVEYIKNNKLFKYLYDEEELFEIITDKQAKDDLLRMLGDNNES